MREGERKNQNQTKQKSNFYDLVHSATKSTVLKIGKLSNFAVGVFLTTYCM